MKLIWLFLSLLIFSSPIYAQIPTYKIGALLHLTGEFPMQGKAFREGAELAVDEINNNYQVLGYKVNLILEDSQYKPITANLVAKKVLNIDNVDAGIIGTITEAMSVGAAFEAAKTPLMVLWDSAPELDDIGEYTFAIGPWAPSTGEVAAEFSAKKLRAKTAVIIGTSNPWPEAVSKVFTEEFTKAGGKVIGQFMAEPSEADFRTIITKAQQLSPDVFYCPVPNNIITFFKQLKQSNIKVPVITGDNLTDTIIKELGSAAEGIYQTQVSDPNSEQTKSFANAYQDKFHKKPEMILFSAWAYDSIKLLASALALAQGDRLVANKNLYKIQNYSGASGIISINKNGSSPTRVKMFQIKKQKLELLKN